jgi:DNA-binding Lrp family transcriptional regulator
MELNWKSTIPTRYLIAKDINSTQKILIGLISNLSNLRGYCFASNEYLSELLNVSKTTTSQLISDLEKKGYIGRIIYRNDKQEVEQRVLTINEDLYPPTFSDIPPLEKEDTLPLKNDIPPLENHKYNSKINNKVNNKINNTYAPTKIFKVPILNSVIDYFTEKDHMGEANKFFNYYESNGWKVGKNPMKNWKAAANNWINNSSKYNKNGNDKKSNFDIIQERHNRLNEHFRKIDELEGRKSIL